MFLVLSIFCLVSLSLWCVYENYYIDVDKIAPEKDVNDTMHMEAKSSIVEAYRKYRSSRGELDKELRRSTLLALRRSQAQFDINLKAKVRDV